MPKEQHKHSKACQYEVAIPKFKLEMLALTFMNGPLVFPLLKYREE